MEWIRDPKSGNWIAEDEIAPHFLVKYTISGDEKDLWCSIAEFWRERDSEPDKYDIDELYGMSHVDSLESMKHEVEQYHTSQIRPEIEALFRSYQSEESTQTE